MTFAGDFRKLRKRAERQGWRVVEKKETWLFYPPLPRGCRREHMTDRYQPCRIGHTPSSQRTWVNFVKCLERKGLR